jgi:hypothetical protein
MHANLFLFYVAQGKLKLSDADTKKRLDVVKAERKVALEKADPRWVECYDPATEEFYYWNTETHDVVWEKPDTYLAAADDETMSAVLRIQCLWRAKRAKSNFRSQRKRQNLWVETMDEDSGKCYYYNTDTHDVQWEKPAEFLAGAKTDEELKDTLKKAFEGKLRLKNKELENQVKTAQENAKRGQQAAVIESGEVWVAVYDSEKDMYYYWESHTNVTTWEKPTHFIASADDETMSSVIKIQNVYRGRKARQKVRQVAVDSGQYNQDDLDLMFKLEDGGSGDQSSAPPEDKLTRGSTWKQSARKRPVANKKDILNKHEHVTEATARIEKLNDEERKMRLEMEELRRKKALAEQMERDLEAKLELERRQKAAEEQERLRLLRIQEKKERRDERLRLKREKKIAESAERMALKKQKLDDNEKRRVQKELRLKLEEEDRIAREQAERELWLQGREDARVRKQEQRVQDMKEWNALLVDFQHRTKEEEAAFSAWTGEQLAICKQTHEKQAQEVLKHRELERMLVLSHGPWDAAAYHCSTEEFDQLLSEEVEACKMRNDTTGDFFLHVACWNGDVGKVRLLLTKYNADVNALDNPLNRVSPLHEAARGGHVDVVKFLLEMGAKFDALNKDMETPLHVATRGGHHRVCKLLLLKDKENLGTWTMKNARGCTAACILKNVRAGGEQHGELDRLFRQVEERVEQIRMMHEEEKTKVDFENKTYRQKQSRALKGLRKQVKGGMNMARQ